MSASLVLKVLHQGGLSDITSHAPNEGSGRLLGTAQYVHNGSLWIPAPVSASGETVVEDMDDVKTAVESIAGEDFATQTTLEALLAKVSDDPATQTTLAAILAAVATETTLDDVKTAAESLAALVSEGRFQTEAQLSGSLPSLTIAEAKTSADAVANVVPFAANIDAIAIWHDELTPQSFTVNGLTITAPPGGIAFQIGGSPDDEVTIPAGVTCVLYRLV